MAEAQVNDIGFAWDEWEYEFRSIMNRMTDDEWGNLDDNLRRMEEHEEGIFTEIKKHSEDKGEIVEAVSYTHLDVYKRQMYECATGKTGRTGTQQNDQVSERIWISRTGSTRIRPRTIAPSGDYLMVSCFSFMVLGFGSLEH